MVSIDPTFALSSKNWNSSVHRLASTSRQPLNERGDCFSIMGHTSAPNREALHELLKQYGGVPVKFGSDDD